MGRPRTRNVAMINGRITPEQMEWLEEKAAQLGGNLSAALRQAITDARLLEQAREDYEVLRLKHPDWQIPRQDDEPGDSALKYILSIRVAEAGDISLRMEEAEGER